MHVHTHTHTLHLLRGRRLSVGQHLDGPYQVLNHNRHKQAVWWASGGGLSLGELSFVTALRTGWLSTDAMRDRCTNYMRE